MIVKPKIRGFVCVTAHPVGCAAHIQEHIDYVKQQDAIQDGPKNVLVLGGSTGYGLSSRVTAAYACKASTLGVAFERPANNGRPASPGWYNTVAFEKAAREEGLYAESINGDAFSDEIKQQTIDKIKNELGPIDLVIYSLAAPRRTDPKTEAVYKSTLKPIDQAFTGKTVDTDKDLIQDITLEPASPDEIEATQKVMGGEDWELWIEALADAGLLAQGCHTVAYSYIGPKVTWPIYKNGTIGKAKEHLDSTALKLNKYLQEKLGGHAFVSVNKAVVTQASSAIPVVPLYNSLLLKIMKAKNLHEGCIEQIYRLFSQHLYQDSPLALDDIGRIRIDDWEMREDVQEEVKAIWPQLNTENLRSLTDYDDYGKEFLKLFGFGVDGVDYEQDVDIDIA